MIETPCIGVCTMGNGKCIGCFRTSQEIRNWLYFTEEERKKITKLCIKKMKKKINY